MAYWLMKSEPGTWSWDDQVKDGVADWDGVRNYQASNNLKAMKKGDRCFFYHSVNEKQIVGIVEVVKTVHPDSTDPEWECVDIAAVKAVPNPVTLSDIKGEKRLADMALVKISRLSVQPVTDKEWQIVSKMAGL